MKVYSVDVGHGQLAWKLRSDERVVCMEKTNFRYLTRDDIDDDLDFASVDVSFISLTKILIPARKLLKDGGALIVEHGYDQGDSVRELFESAGLKKCMTISDYGGNDRVTLGIK